MNDLAGQSSASQWKNFIKLGEDLLSLPNTALQCKFVEKTVRNSLKCKAKVWLVDPFYPLPGEPEIEILTEHNAPPIVWKTYQTGLTHFQTSSTSEVVDTHSSTLAHISAVPLISKKNLLGILLADRSNGKPLTPLEVEFVDGFASTVAISLEVSRQLTLKNWRARQLELVQSVSEQIANINDLNELCERIAQLILQFFNFYYVAIYTIDKDYQYLNLQAMKHQADCGDFTPPDHVRLGQGMIGHVAQEGKEILAPDVRQEIRYISIECLPQTRSELSLPLKTEQAIYGVLDFQSDKLNAFHQNDLVVLHALANTVALALESAHLYQNLQQRANQIAAIIEFTMALTSILDLEELIQKAAELIHDRFHYAYVHIFTIQPVQKKIIYGSGAGARSHAMREHDISYSLDDPLGIIPWVARNGKSYITNDVDTDPIYRESELPPTNTQSELGVPVTFAGEALGVLDLQSDVKNAFTHNDIQLMEALASNIAIAIRNANLYRSEKWRVQVADSFREVSESISANVALDEILDAILVKLETNLPCDASAIWLFEETENPNGNLELNIAATHNIETEKIAATLEDQRVRARLEYALFSEYPIIRQPGDDYGPLGSALGFPADYSSIAAPLRAGDKTLGVLTLAHHTPGRYGDEAQDMTATFASYAAVAIQNARLFEEAQEQAWVSTVLLQVSEASQSVTSVDELLSTMVRLPPLLIGVRLSAIFLWDDEHQAFNLKNWYGADKTPAQTHFFVNDTPALTRLNSIRSTIYIDDAAAELNLSPETIPSDVSTMVMVPLISRGNLMGGLLVGYHQSRSQERGNAISQQMLAILQGIAHQTAVAIENLQLEESQEEEAYVTAVLLEVAQSVVSQNDLDDILDTVVHLMPILVGIDTCIILLWDKKNQIFQPAQVYTGNDEDELHLLGQIFNPGEFPIIDKTYDTHQLHFSTSISTDLAINDWMQIPSYPEDDLTSSTVFFGGSILLAVPLVAKGELLGIMLAKETMSSLAFQEKRLEIITGIAQLIALAIQNEKYKLEMVETQRMEQEIQLARQSQRTFLPAELPKLYRWDMDARWKPARQVGGDFYDIIPLDKDRIGLVIADVADKGMPAALYMTVVRTLIRAYSQQYDSPAALLAQVNNLLMPDAQNGIFVTAVYAILSKRANKIMYANAGHNPPLILHSGDGKVDLLPKGGISLGVLEDIQLEDHVFHLQTGDYLLFYTDGVTEAFSEDGNTFGNTRLMDFLKSKPGVCVADLLDALEIELENFAGSMPPSDDITLLCLKRQS